jgi:hypothetical protein
MDSFFQQDKKNHAHNKNWAIFTLPGNYMMTEHFFIKEYPVAGCPG